MILRMLNDPFILDGSTISYWTKANVCCITKHGKQTTIETMEKLQRRPNYLFLDNVDPGLDMPGTILNLGLTSGDKEALKDFRKRVNEARECGKQYWMLALDFREMCLIFPHLPSAEQQFRFDVLGGNPRAFLTHEVLRLSREIKSRIFPELQTFIFMLFGRAYDYRADTEEGRRTRWAMHVIATEVERSADADTSLFRADFAM